jgi:hypothetical protein
VRFGDLVELDLEHLSDPEPAGTLTCCGRVLDLQHRHVATVAAPPLEQPSGGRAVLHGGDELQESVADREDRVAQPEVADRGVGERLVQGKFRPQQLHRAIEVTDCDHGLAQARHRLSIADVGAGVDAPVASSPRATLARIPNSVVTNMLPDRLTSPARYAAQIAGSAWPQLFRPLLLELVAHRPIREVFPGIHHWTAIHPRIRVPVDSYYIEPARLVLDPMIPREGLEWFELREPPGQIVLTNRHHLRHAEQFAKAFGCPIRCSEVGLHEFEGGPSVEGFSFGEELAPGVTAHQLGAICPDDAALHVRVGDRGALAFADGLTRPRGGGLRFVPGFLMGDDPAAVEAELRESLRRLLDLDFDSLLFAHGEPLIGGGRAALSEFLG